MEGVGGFAKLCFFIFVVVFAVMTSTTAVDTLYPDQTLKDGETLVSANGNFELGFFYMHGMCGSVNRYVGILEKRCSCAILVINRDAPLTNTSGELSLDLQGRMVIRYSNGHVIWSSEKFSEGKLVGHLLDNGNFVLREETAKATTQGAPFFEIKAIF